MNFEHSPSVKELMAKLETFMRESVLPADAAYQKAAERRSYPLKIIEPLKAKARAQGLWNLFLPGLQVDEPGTRLSNSEYAPLAEIMGRVPWASEVFNCSAPDTGNMELLHLFASSEQRRQWLVPLLEGEIRSGFAMTEPDVASSDPTNLQTTIQRDGASYLVNGRKWFTTGVAHPHCRLIIVMGVSNTDAGAPRLRRHSMVLVSLDTPGVEVVRDLPIMNHYSPEGHCEVHFRNVRVPIENLLGQEGSGFAMAQARLGPGRVHHCMRAIGQSEYALELMCRRVQARRAFGQALAEYSGIKEAIGRSRIEIEQTRLLVLRAAWRIDQYGVKATRADVSAIKVAAAELLTRVTDRAIQAFGAMGLTNDTPLASLWTWGRALRFIDGPDEVHLQTVARDELRKVPT
jgi:acyl-CoA dehydrogenase